MRESSNIVFASSNSAKYDEVRRILDRYDIKVEQFECDLAEIQSDSLRKIALSKAADALSRCGRAVIVEDAGLYIDSLGGFPGPYSAFVYRTLGNAGVLRALGTQNRDAAFRASVAYAAPDTEPRVFESDVHGTISTDERGSGWGYDPIFIPQGYAKTYAEIGKQKNDISHRAQAMTMFAEWFTR